MAKMSVTKLALVIVSLMLVVAFTSQLFNSGSDVGEKEDVSVVKVPVSPKVDNVRSEPDNSRYGFAVNASWSSSDSFTVRDVSTGDVDGDGDLDIVSCGDGTCKVYKNDGTGTDFTDGWEVTGLTGVATQVKLVNADGDSDLDIVLVSQTVVPASQDAFSAGNVWVRVYINDGSGSFGSSPAATQSFTAGFESKHEYYMTNYAYMDVGDMDGDSDVDIAVAVTSGGSALNTVTYYILEFTGSAFTVDSSRVNTSTGADGYIWGHVAWGDLDDGAGGDDLVCCLSGLESWGSGPLRPAECYIYFNSGTAPAATATLVGQWAFSGAQYGNYVYSCIAGDATDDGKDDIIIGTNYDLGGAYMDGMIWVIESLGSGNFKKPAMWYQTTNNWQPRDLVLGSFDMETGTDLISNYWYDITSPMDFTIDEYAFEFGSGRQTAPQPNFFQKWIGREGYGIPDGSILCVDGGDFDKASPLVEDVVAGGARTTVYTVFYAPNNLPKMTNHSWSNNPILNDGVGSTKLNISVQDLDGSNRDLGDGSVLIDLTPIGGEPTLMTNIVYDGNLNLRYYHQTMTVDPSTSPGLIKLPITITDRCMETIPGPSPGITFENVTLTVQQFNRPPEIKDSALKELILDEDQAAYTIPDISDFFEDPDGDDLAYDLGSEIQPEYNSPSGLLKCMYDDTDHSTKIIPQPNKFGFDQVPVRAYDGKTYRVTHKINVTVNSINDAPWIHNTGQEDDWKNNSFLLSQDTRFQTDIDATDIEGDLITFSIDFPDMSKNLFGINDTSGEIEFTPTNEDKGDHKAIITVTDWNDINGESSKTFWFNISDVNDPPRFLKIGKYTIEEGTNDLIFNVTEHEWLNFSISATDPDIDIGVQESVFFSSDMSKLNESFFLVENRNDPTKADVSFWAHGIGILCTVPEKGYGPHLGKLTVTDTKDHTLKSTINISIGIENVNDPPTRARIDAPANNETFLEMEVEFVAGIVTDPDQIYGDKIRYVWDFDDSDGINNEDGNGTQPTHIYEENGDYLVTLHVFDKENLTSKYAQVLVHIQGDASGLDADKDGLPNEWEEKWGLDKYSAVGDDGWDGDPDGDGVVNWREMELFTDPLDEDTDGDGVNDGDDAYPNDSKRWKVAEAEADWTWLIILLVILAVVLITIVIIIVLVALVVSKRKKEEDEAQAIAEAAAQDDPYGEQKLYSEIPQEQQQMPPPQQPVQPEGGESLDFEKPEGIEPVEGEGPPGPDSQLPPGDQPQAALPPGPEGGSPGMEGEGPPPGMEGGPPPGAEGPPPSDIGMPPQGEPGPELQPPPSLPPGSEDP